MDQVGTKYGQFESQFTMAISNIVSSLFSQFEGQFTVAKCDMVGSKLG